jgi:hypothetical protein
MIEVPKDHPEYALDTVTMGLNVNEFSQSWLGETIVSHRVVTEEEALEICDADNEIYSDWTKEEKLNTFFTKENTTEEN